MGDWNGEAGWNRDVLERIVVLLFSLANLADLAAGALYLRRRRVLRIVSHGEAEARAFVIGIASGAPVPTDALEPSGNAALLAVRLRALAMMLCLLLAQGFALPGMAGPRIPRPSHRAAGQAPRRLEAPPVSDTS